MTILLNKWQLRLRLSLACCCSPDTEATSVESLVRLSLLPDHPVAALICKATALSCWCDRCHHPQATKQELGWNDHVASCFQRQLRVYKDRRMFLYRNILLWIKASRRATATMRWVSAVSQNDLEKMLLSPCCNELDSDRATGVPRSSQGP